MHIATNRNLLNFTELPSLNFLAGGQPAIGQGEFYQQIVHFLVKGVYDKQLFCKLADILVRLAHQAYILRRVDIIEQASQVLLGLPLPHEYQSIGLYYYAISIEKQGRRAEARALLERVAEEAPIRYRARATQMLGLYTYVQGDLKAALSLYVEAARIAASNNWCDPSTMLTAQHNIALLKSMDGNHPDALADLEKLFPLVRVMSASQPSRYYHHLNSYAVELGEVGRLDEAHNVCKIVLASPYAFAYPEWRETWNELQIRSYRTPRSFVPVSWTASKSDNVVPMPVPESNASLDSASKQSGQPARVLDLTAWIKKMPKEPNGNEKEPQTTDDMTERERIYRIINLVTTPGLSEEKQLEILRLVEKIVAKPDTTSDEDADKD